MVAECVAMVVLVVALAAEWLHARRTRRVAELAFGGTTKPRTWARSAPAWRAAGLAAIAWGLTTLLLLVPKVHEAEQLSENEMRHLLLVLDVSPSMRLQDAGTEGDISRIRRAREIMNSFFKRTIAGQFWVSVVAVYNGAKPVVVETTDMEVVDNILGDLPMHHAFHVGETRLFDGLEEAAKMARPWKPRSATMILISDGDTVPTVGMPRLPASISDVLVVGVGDPRAGAFIDGRHSRQDVSTLRQIAVRLGGKYHNGNEKHISTETLTAIAQSSSPGRFEQLTRREYALAAILAGALVIALLPIALHWVGTSYRPGVQPSQVGLTGEMAGSRSEKKVARLREATVS